MTKSPVALAREAVRIAKEALPEYSHRFSPKTFTQPQLFAILVLRQFFKTDYRGVVELLHDFADLRRVLKLKRVPHYSTLWHAEKRLGKKGLWTACWTPFFVAPRPCIC
jgi:hypothetical protein